MEIAAQHDRGGATLEVIREGVDYRQRMILTDRELKKGIRQLQEVRLIRKRGVRYFISPSKVHLLPRTPAGQLSFRRRDWDRLQKILFES